MADWTEDQIATINDQYWLGKPVACPSCGSNVKINLSGRSGFPKSLRARCEGCGERAGFQSASQWGSGFDRDQTVEYVEISLRNGSNACPHDGTTLKVSHRPVLGPNGNSYSVRCPRCGAFGETDWPPKNGDE